MIGLIEGRIIHQEGLCTIILTASGVGYEVKYDKILSPNDVCRIFVAHIVREDSEQLFGFTSMAEKLLFEQLLQVNGVGPKSAFALVSGLGVDKIHQAILMEDSKTLKSVPGIGPKTVAQIILLLKDKLLKGDSSRNSIQVKPSFSASEMTDALMACRELGFKDDEVLPLIKKTFTSGVSSEDLIKTVLQELR